MRNIVLLFLLLFSLRLNAQQGDGGLPKGFKLIQSLKTNDYRFFNEPDVQTLRAEDAHNDKLGNGPWRFGYNHNTSLTMSNSGTWYALENGGKIWRLVVVCDNALTINFTLDHVAIPEGNQLFFYNFDHNFILGNFTENHLYKGNLGTELIPGSKAVVEYYVAPENLQLPATLNINTVTHGYRTALEYQEKAFGTSGACNMNVNCPDGSPWANQRDAAVMLVSGSNGFCSGALVNNTLQDKKPYVLTANHCSSSNDFATWVFRFKWQAPSCTNPGASPTFESLSGSVLRARRQPSDFCLVEITGGLVSNTVPANCDPYFNGWDNSGTIPTSTVCIHHPDGDITKISFDDDPPIISQAMGSSEANATWSVVWDRNTTTEGGSSGSPLFDNNHRIIGQLWGGSASCSNHTGADHYGRFANSWEPAGSNQTNQLKYWLDPTGLGAIVINGTNLSGTSIALDASLSSPQGLQGILCSADVSPQFNIVNMGSTTLTSATINYGFDGLTNQSYNWNGSLAQYQTAVVTLPTSTLTAGSHTFKAIVSNPNGGTDLDLSNDTLMASFTSVSNGQIVQLVLQTDCYGDEISWNLQDNLNTVLYNGGPYSQSSSGTLVNKDFCLSEGCYKFTINDDFGDGMDGPSFCPTGYYTIKLTDGTLLAELTTSEAAFGSIYIDTFCVGPVGLSELNTLNWNVYPNPARERIYVSTSVAGEKSILVTSVTGQKIAEFITSDAQVEIPMNGLAKGMYVITLKTAASISQKNLMIE